MSALSFSAIAPGNLAVVTGAASGIGLAAARAFAARGMRIAMVDQPGQALDAAAAAIDGATGYSVDVADAAAMKRSISARRCDRCGSGLWTHAAAAVPEELRPALRQVAALVDGDDASRAEALASLPSALAHLDAGAAFESVLSVARILDPGLPLADRALVDAERQMRLCRALAAAWHVVLAWPVAGADLVALSNDADGALTRLREFGTDSKERPALPEVTATLRVLTVAPERAVGVKPAARLLGVTEGEVARARDAGRLGEVVAIHHGKLRMSLDREEIEELSEKRLDRISRHAAGELLGIPAYGVEQLVVSGHLDVQRHSWLLDRHGAPVLLRRDVEALRDRIVAASFGAVTNPVTLSVAAKAFGGGPKPWAMIVCMLLAGRLDCAAAVESDGSLRIVVSAAAIPLVASLPVGAGRPIYSQLEAVEVLNLTAKHAAVLTDLRLAADVGSRNGWRLDGEAVDVIASSRASMAELMSRSCASQKTVASHLARCGVLPLDGFGFDRARALKVLADWIEAGSPKPSRRRSRRGVEHAAAGRMA